MTGIEEVARRLRELHRAWPTAYARSRSVTGREVTLHESGMVHAVGLSIFDERTYGREAIPDAREPFDATAAARRLLAAARDGLALKGNET